MRGIFPVIALLGVIGSNALAQRQITVSLGDGAYRGSPVLIYDNNYPEAALSSSMNTTDFNTVWGDTLNMTQSDSTLDLFTCSVYNASSAPSFLNSATVTVSIFRASDNTPLGSFSTPVDFGAGTNGVPGGQWAVLTFTNLAALATPIVIDIANIVVRQQISSPVGTGLTTLGVIGATPPIIGSSPPTFYKDDPSSPPPGFYSLSNGMPADPIYEVGLLPEPSILGMIGLTALAVRARRR